MCHTSDEFIIIADMDQAFVFYICVTLENEEATGEFNRAEFND